METPGPSAVPGPAEQESPEPFTNGVMNAYNATKAAHPDDIVLFQMGDFFEMYDRDAETAAPLLGLALTTRPVPGAGRVKMCGFPVLAMERYVEKLRDKYDVTISAVGAAANERDVYSLRSTGHETEQPQPTLGELFAQYKPVVITAVTEDTAYRNACGHSDHENAVIEGNAAIKRAVINSHDLTLIRLYSDVPEFRNRLHREVIDETYPQLHELLRPLSQDDITKALQSWNGDMDSKRRVVRYMEAHGREKGTAEWLSREYGGDVNKNLFFIRQGSPEMLELPWPKVQRGIAQLIKEDRFFTEQELDNFEDIDPAAIREQLESGQPSAFVEQVMADVGQVAAQEEQAEDAPSESAVPSGQPIKEEDTTAPEVINAADQPPRDPLAPAYNVGDTVYLDKTAFEITDINLFDVQLRDPSLTYPILRSEPKDRFEQLLWKDSRNGHITEFMPADLGKINEDFREVLTSGLLTDQDKTHISGWLRSGESNTRIGQRLSEQFADRAETMQLTTGETADYFTSTTGIEVKILDKFSSGVYMGWALVPSVIRALYQQELDGFSHTPVQREAVEPEPVRPAQEATTIYPGDKNGLPFDVVVERLHFDEPEQAPPETASAVQNFRITDDHLGEGGLKEKFRRNLEAVTTLHEIEFDKRTATPEEQEIMSRYVGWGALADAFDPKKPDWANEYKELQVVLTPEEYKSARASTLNAHYTSPTVIKAIYEAVGNMGFTGGNILEPACGVGNFFGLLPESMAASKLYGTELDSLTGRIAQQLYPKANITVAGFETTDRRDFYDLAVGNVPFGQYKVNDRAYNRLGFTIHNYFFAKALDQVRPGGVVAFVTSRYTMDAKGEEVRKYLAQRADLLGAIRLPNNAFKANAGTEVVSDILFLQKRDSPQTELPDWVHTGENEDGFTINRYFVDHPEMILGRQSAESTQYAKQDFTVEPIEGLVLADQLHDAIQYIRGEYREAEPPELDEAVEQESVTIPADPDVKNFSYTIVNGDVYFRENSIMAKRELNATATERVKGMVELRDCVHRLIDLQMSEMTPESTIVEQQRELNRLYDSFTAKFGLINDRGNRLAFSDDSAYYLLCALEEIDENGRLERKADMFTKRTISPHRAVDHVDTPSEALAVSIAEKARVDMPYMARLTGKTEAELERALTGVIFRDVRCDENPDYIPKAYADLNRFPLVTADEYLSGNVRRKLRMAQAMAQVLPPEEAAKIQPNVEALTAAQPRDLDASEIEVRLGTDWIDKKYIQQFMYETLDTPWNLRRGIQVNHFQTSQSSAWQITGKYSISNRDIPAYTTYGTSRANAYEILEDSLNLRDVRVYDTVEGPDGKDKRVLNGKETTLAQQKQQLLRNAFRDWIWRDPQRRQALVRQYNEEMNSTRPREYDGSHITFSGMNPEIKLLPHQVNAVARVLYGGNSLLAHEVGAGKTFEMIAAAMESKRLGLCRKSIFVVPNHLIEQWASEFMRLYPSANILVTRKKDFETARRKKFCARIATGDYDAVIIGQSQFEKIPISFERQEQIIQDEIREVMAGIEEVKESNGERFTVKQMVGEQKRLETKLENLRADQKKDNVVTFEQLGVDRMFVDESDFYKNLFMVTKMRNVAGLSTTDAQKSSDMFAKCRYLDEITGNRGIIFATGTPISNSMTEMFTIHRYLQYDRLQEMNMGHFDCWASRFGETATVLELAPEGTGYRPRTRFSKFFNLPELMNLFKEVADVKTADQLNLPTPEVEYHTVASKPTEHQKAMVKELSERASRVHSGSVDPHIDNMLKITSDGRKLGLDQRIIDPLLPDEPGTKVNRCVENILNIWREGAADRLTQLVFCDISTPQAPVKKKKEGVLEEDTARPFTVYDDIRSKLIAAGMPPEEIAFIHDAKTDKQKKDLFAKVNAGQVRVLIGSTSKMGAGTNVQKKLIAMHDLDCPWRPRDLIQRKGRIERRGNDNPKVHVFRYVTEGTFDAYLWQTVENKQKFISQIMTSKSPVRSCEDVDEAALSYAEIKALCAGDPRIKERMDLDIDVSRLKLLKADHQSQQFRLEDRVLKHIPAEVKQNQEYVAGFKADMETLEAHPHPIVKVEAPPPEADGEQPAAAGPEESQSPAAVELKQGFAGMEIGGVTFTDKAEAGKALIAACKELQAGETKEIGSYRGFSMTISRSQMFEKTQMTLKGEMTHLVDLGEDILGNLVRMDNALEKMPERLKAVEVNIQTLQQQLIAAKAELGKPFPQEVELQEKSARLIELDAALNIDRRASPEQAVAKSARPSVLDSLKRPLPPREKGGPDKPKRSQPER